MQPRISPSTAGIIVPFVKTLAASGAFPASEAIAIAALLRDAARPDSATPPPPETHGQLLTLAQAARRLSCSRRTVARMLSDGTLARKYLRPGRAKSLRIVAAEVEALSAGSGEVAR